MLCVLVGLSSLPTLVQTATIPGTVTDPSGAPVSTIVGLTKNYKVPTSYQYSLGVLQSLGQNAVFLLSYVGYQNRSQSYSQEVALPPQSELPGLACVNSTSPARAPSLVTPITRPVQGLVNYPGFNSILLNTAGANVSYITFRIHMSVGDTLADRLPSTAADSIRQLRL